MPASLKVPAAIGKVIYPLRTKSTEPIPLVQVWENLHPC